MCVILVIKLKLGFDKKQSMDVCSRDRSLKVVVKFCILKFFSKAHA